MIFGACEELPNEVYCEHAYDGIDFAGICGVRLFARGISAGVEMAIQGLGGDSIIGGGVHLPGTSEYGRESTLCSGSTGLVSVDLQRALHAHAFLCRLIVCRVRRL